MLGSTTISAGQEVGDVFGVGNAGISVVAGFLGKSKLKKNTQSKNNTGWVAHLIGVLCGDPDSNGVAHGWQLLLVEVEQAVPRHVLAVQPPDVGHPLQRDPHHTSAF